MTHSVPREADFDLAPNLLDGAMNLNMTTRDCDLVYWLTAVAQGTLKGRAVTGHAVSAPTPEFMREPGPLREALILELGWRSVAEERAVRTLSYFVADAPGIPEMEFFATQVLDEARHSQVFRDHLVELGVPADRLHETIAELWWKGCSRPPRSSASENGTGWTRRRARSPEARGSTRSGT